MYRDCFYDIESLLADIRTIDGDEYYEHAKNSIGSSLTNTNMKRYIKWPRNHDNLPISKKQFNVLLNAIAGRSISIADEQWIRYGRATAYMNECRTGAFPITEAASIRWDAGNNLKYVSKHGTAILVRGTNDMETILEIKRYISDQLARGETTIYVTPEVMPVSLL